jgi:hypothetical protein
MLLNKNNYVGKNIACQAEWCKLERNQHQITLQNFSLYLQYNSIVVIAGLVHPGQHLGINYDSITFFQGKFRCRSSNSMDGDEGGGSPSAVSGGNRSCKLTSLVDVAAGGGLHRLTRNLRRLALQAEATIQNQTEKVGRSVYVSMFITCGAYERAERQHIINYRNASSKLNKAISSKNKALQWR